MKISMEAPELQGAFSLHSEIALVTGGGSGLGLGIANCLAAAGARVILVGRREAELAKAAAEIGSHATYIPHDINRLETAPELVRAAEHGAGGPISILINNAGIDIKKPVIETTSQDFQSVLDTHILAAHALTARCSRVWFPASMDLFCS